MAALVLAGHLDLGNPLGYATAALGPVHALCTAAAFFFLVARSMLLVSVLPLR